MFKYSDSILLLTDYLFCRNCYCTRAILTASTVSKWFWSAMNISIFGYHIIRKRSWQPLALIVDKWSVEWPARRSLNMPISVWMSTFMPFSHNNRVCKVTWPMPRTLECIAHNESFYCCCVVSLLSWVILANACISNEARFRYYLLLGFTCLHTLSSCGN